MKKYIIPCCLLCMGFYGCDKDNGGKSVNVDIGVNISYVNTAYTDLLNPAAANGIKKEDIDIYYLVNGIKTPVNNPRYDFPENFMIRQVGTNSKYFLTVFASTATDDKGIGTTYISIKNQPEDTVRAEITTIGGSNTYVSKIWFNGIFKKDTITIIR
jgi:hypothetical protein